MFVFFRCCFLLTLVVYYITNLNQIIDIASFPACHMTKIDILVYLDSQKVLNGQYWYY